MQNKFFKFLVAFLNFIAISVIVAFASMIILQHQPTQTAKSAINFTLGNLLWQQRPMDVLGQAVILASAIFGIILLFRTEENK